jgi:hypothetical protein
VNNRHRKHAKAARADRAGCLERIGEVACTAASVRGLDPDWIYPTAGRRLSRRLKDHLVDSWERVRDREIVRCMELTGILNYFRERYGRKKASPPCSRRSAA